MPHRTNVGVQYLRGIAVLAVVLSHSASFTSSAYHSPPLFGGALEFGRLGVDIFFQISGFVIAIVSLRETDLAPSIGVGRFLARRFVRIVPLMWIAILAFAALQWLGHVSGSGLGYLRTALLLPGPLIPSIVWTLRQELIFYVIFALSFLTGRRWRFVPILWFAAIMLVPRGPQTLWSHDAPLALLLNLRNLGFPCGLFVALAWLRYSSLWRYRSPIEPLAILLTASALVIFIIVPAFKIDSGIGLILILVPLLLFAVHVECPPGLARRVGELFGNASYSIYLFHYPAISVLMVALRKVAPASPPAIIVVIVLILSTAVGIAAYFLIERPLLAGVRDRVAQRTAQPTAAL